MYAQVVPIKRGAITLPFFDYIIPEYLEKDILPGQLVVVPFRNTDILAILISTSPNSDSKPSKLREILSIEDKTPLISRLTIAYLLEICELYQCSLGSLIKSTLLPLKKRKLKKIYGSLKKFPISVNLFKKPSVYIYKNKREKNDYLKQKIDKKHQTLILVPEILDAKNLTTDLEILFPGLCEIITSADTEKDLFDKWLNIRNGKSKIIVGTRNALFLSFFDLHQIIIDQSSHFSHKSWDASPRFHTRDAAIILAKNLGATLSFISHTPSVDELYFCEKNVYNAESELLPSFSSTAAVINMKQEFRAKNYSIISLPLQNEIEHNTDGNIYLYCNRRGSASYVSCRDCTSVLACHNCHRPYVYYNNNKELRCNICKIIKPLNPVCAECGGINLAFYGEGVEGVVSEIRKLFPNDKRQIIQIDSESKPIEILNTQNYIIVGTQYSWSLLDWSKIGVMGIIDADTPLYTPEYLGVENLWQTIHDASFRLSNDIPLLIQTRHPEHIIYEALHDPANFYKQQLSERKMFGYPPFNYLLKLLTFGDSVTNVEKEAQKLYLTLNQLTKSALTIKINPPVALFPPFNRGKYWQAIIIKLPLSNYKKSIKLINKSLPLNWKIDPNPITLLSI